MIGIVGGTGPEGRGLALRFAMAGEQVAIGSRDESRAADAAESVLARAHGGLISGATNEDTCSRADIVLISVPYAAHRETVESLGPLLAGKIVVDVVAPVAFSKGVARALPVPEGSAALEAQALMPGSTVAAAFHTISAHDLLVPDRPVESDVVVCADDAQAREVVMALAEKIRGVRAINGGGLHNARYVEGLTALLLNINRIYETRSAIRIVGV